MKQAVLVFLANKKEIEDSRGYTLLRNAAGRGEAETARFLMEKGTKVDAKTLRGRTPLYVAATFKKYNVLELLIQKGANVNELCPDESALFLSANNGDENLAKILIDNNADINIIKTATNGFTPLFWAAVSNHQNIVNLFLRNGANVNAKENDRQETALHKMAHQGKLEITKILLENEANVHERDLRGFSALHVAAN